MSSTPQNFKPLASVRDTCSEEYDNVLKKMPRDHWDRSRIACYRTGFDAGASAVKERAQILVDALIEHGNSDSEMTYLEKINNSIKALEKFKESVK